MQGNKVRFPIRQPNKDENVSTTLTLESKSLTFSQHSIQPFKSSQNMWGKRFKVLQPHNALPDLQRKPKIHQLSHISLTPWLLNSSIPASFISVPKPRNPKLMQTHNSTSPIKRLKTLLKFHYLKHYSISITKPQNTPHVKKKKEYRPQ